MLKRQKFSNDGAMPYLVEVEGETVRIQMPDATLFAGLVDHPSGVAQSLHRTKVGKYIFMVTVLDEGCFFDGPHSGWLTARYLDPQSALIMRNGWKGIQDQPSIEHAKHLYPELFA